MDKLVTIDRKALSTTEEMKIVALLARGDTYEGIKKYLKENGMRSVTNMTISAVKKRNKENLDLIKSRVLEKEMENAVAIKDKANSLIKKRLDQVEDENKVLALANLQFLNEEIDLAEYVRITKTMKTTGINELVAVSREMHSQGKDDSDDVKNTPQKDLSALVEAIRSGDEVVLQQMIFNKDKGENNDKRNTVNATSI